VTEIYRLFTPDKNVGEATSPEHGHDHLDGPSFQDAKTLSDLLQLGHASLLASVQNPQMLPLNYPRSSSSRLCHGYKTGTLKHNADVAIAKLVNENARVTIIVEGQQDIDMSLGSDF